MARGEGQLNAATSTDGIPAVSRRDLPASKNQIELLERLERQQGLEPDPARILTSGEASKLIDGLMESRPEPSASTSTQRPASEAQRQLIATLQRERALPVEPLADETTMAEAKALIDELKAIPRPERPSAPARPATEKQLEFLRRLRAERGVETPEDETELSASEASKLIGELKELPKKTSPAQPPHPATEAQKQLLATLRAERGREPEDDEQRSFREASALIEELLALPRSEAAAEPAAELPTAQRPATQKQLELIERLRRQEGTPDPLPGNLSVAEASELIEELGGGKLGERYPEVLPGRYAVPGEDGKLHFYIVEQGEKPGSIVLSVQASSREHELPFGRAKRAILEKIAGDPLAASAAYGRELGVCGVCGRALTDEDSRAFGIGPVCRRKLGAA